MGSVSAAPASAGEVAREAGRPGQIRAFYVGHSLESDVPDIVLGLAGSDFQFKEQFIPGASLAWQWSEAQRRKQEFEPQFQARYDQELPKGYDAVVLIESVPRGAEWVGETVDHLGKFAEAARKGNPKVRVFFYEPWHSIKSGTPQNDPNDRNNPSSRLSWRTRVDADRPMWKGVVDETNRRWPGSPPVKMIPGATALGALSDAIDRGEVDGFRSIRDMFDDDIHLNHYGKYFIGLVHYAALFGKDPTGKPFDIKNRWGVPYWNAPNWQKKTWTPPSAKAVKAMQRIAWTVVKSGS